MRVIELVEEYSASIGEKGVKLKFVKDMKAEGRLHSEMLRVLGFFKKSVIKKKHDCAFCSAKTTCFPRFST